MANIFEKPVVTPFRTFWQSDRLASDATTVKYKSFNPSFNSRTFDEDFHIRTLRPFQRVQGFLQPFQQCDIARDMFYSSDGTAANWSARLLDKDGNIVNGKTLTVSLMGGPYTGMYCYSVQFTMWDLPEGVYYIQYRYSHGASTYSYFLNEPFDLKQIHEDTIRFDYRNSYNDQDIIYYSDSWEFQLRLKGHIAPISTDAQFAVYEDQPLNTTMVRFIPFRSHELALYNIPEWMADKVNRIMGNDTTKIEGKKWTREAASKLEHKPSETSANTYYTLKVREAENTISVLHNATCITLNDMPQTKYFWIERIMIEGSYVTIRQGFNGKRNFLDYLNTNQRVGDGYWAEDPKGKLVFYADNDFSFSGSWVLDNVDIIKYGMKLVIAGSGDIEIDVTNTGSTNYYAVNWGAGVTTINKTALTAAPTATNIAESYSVDYVHTAYLYFSDYASMQDVATNVNIISIDCDIAPGCTNFNPFTNATGCAQFESNPFQYVTALDYFDAQNMNLNTWSIDALIRWAYDCLSHFDPSAYIEIASQQLPAIPSAELGRLLGAIRAAGINITTDS